LSYQTVIAISATFPLVASSLLRAALKTNLLLILKWRHRYDLAKVPMQGGHAHTGDICQFFDPK
jgi:hypothetical protein